jgi:uncharacterized SAM-binding protein YcdF (DUF218 family)
MDTATWIFSKVVWMLVDPDNGLLLLLVLGTILLFTDRKNLGRRLVSITSVALLVLTVFPWSGLILLPLENRFPIPEPLTKPIDGIIVLSGAEKSRITKERGQVVLRDSAERLTTFVGLSLRYPEAKLIFSGGAGSLGKQEFKDTDTARLLFEQLGLSTDRVHFESESRNTVENARNSFDLARPQMGEKWVLVTSASHMPRAVGVFRKIGWSVIPYPVDFNTTGKIEFGIHFTGLENVNLISWALHEWVGIVAYWVMGRTSELFPGPE